MHIAAAAANPNVFKLLLTDSTSSSSSNNKANSNVVNKDGLTAFHILLAQLVDMASLENRPIETRGPNPPSNGEIEQRSRDVMECLILLAKERNLTMDFENSPKLAAAAVERAPYVRSKMTLKKIATMTPLQILCSFQTWNAKPITTGLHNSLAELVQLLLDQGANPNGTAAKGELPGTVPGSTPPVFLAATRGYYKVIQVFKENSHTDFLVVNKFDQTILHMVLKAGYYNKIVIHGEESGEVNINTLHELFSGNNRTIQYQMRGIVNNRDSYGNTALHYARPYPSPEVTLVTLLANGAKLDMNAQGQINMNPKALHRYFLEHCIIPVGDDIDDEDFKIKMDFRLFEKALDMGTEEMQVAKARADDAWALQVEQGKNNQTQPHFPGEDFTTDSGGGGDGNDGSGKVDTKRLEIFAREENLHHLLKSPLMTAFLEMEMNSLKIRYFLDFMLYLLFVIALFFYLSERYTLNPTAVDEALIIYRDEEMDYNVTYTLICLVLLLLILMGQEIFQIFKVGKRYFTNPGNYIEWIVMILVLFDVIPWHFLSFLGEGGISYVCVCLVIFKILISLFLIIIITAGDTELQRHWAALTLLIAFMQLYLLLVRVVPDTPIPIYINMFTTVLKTYTLILLSYMAFILSFAYSFFLIFSPRPAADEQMVSADNSTTPSNTTVKDSVCIHSARSVCICVYYYYYKLANVT